MSAITSYVPLIDQIVETNGNICVKVPKNPLKDNSLEITTDQPYLDWSQADHSHAFSSLNKTIAVWKDNQIADQYFVYGKYQSEKTFSWEIIPYYKPMSALGRTFQQFLVLWHISFGRAALSKAQMQHQVQVYQKMFYDLPLQIKKTNQIAKDNDAFCREEVIQKQLIFEGRTIRLLYNYAPIGFSGERLHFLIVTKVHKKQFNELSEAEYDEASQLTQRLIRHFSQTRPVNSVYLFHKTGFDAGQTVPHWHLHLIVSTSHVQDLFGKLTVLKNMLIPPSPMKEDDLKKKVDSLKNEIKID